MRNTKDIITGLRHALKVERMKIEANMECLEDGISRLKSGEKDVYLKYRSAFLSVYHVDRFRKELAEKLASWEKESQEIEIIATFLEGCDEELSVGHYTHRGSKRKYSYATHKATEVQVEIIWGDDVYVEKSQHVTKSFSSDGDVAYFDRFEGGWTGFSNFKIPVAQNMNRRGFDFKGWFGWNSVKAAVNAVEKYQAERAAADREREEAQREEAAKLAAQREEWRREEEEEKKKEAQKRAERKVSSRKDTLGDLFGDVFAQIK